MRLFYARACCRFHCLFRTLYLSRYPNLCLIQFPIRCRYPSLTRSRCQFRTPCLRLCLIPYGYPSLSQSQSRFPSLNPLPFPHPTRPRRP